MNAKKLQGGIITDRCQTMFPQPIPPGWIKLQERARQSKDADELSRIIDEMNKLLDEYETRNGYDETASQDRGTDGGQTKN